MNAYDDLDDALWGERYGHICPAERGEIVKIHGVGDKDTYNPKMCEYGGEKILSFRCEARESSIADPTHYHPSIHFARQQSDGVWRALDATIPPFDMLEDPLFLAIHADNHTSVVFGGVRAQPTDDGFVANTEFYKGDSLETLERQPFAVITGMKDVRLSQLPDGRFLLCRRPTIQGMHGRISLHIIDDLTDLEKLSKKELRPLAILDSGYADDWVGTNSAYVLQDKHGRPWIGLLGHLGSSDTYGHKHYAATTYKIKLEDLLDKNLHSIQPTVIATRSCFANGPQKDDNLADVVFPGSLEHIEGDTYRLWAGLSDARIGTLLLHDPFRINT